MSFRSLKYDARGLLFKRKDALNWYLQKGIARNKYKVVKDIEIIFQFKSVDIVLIEYNNTAK